MRGRQTGKQGPEGKQIVVTTLVREGGGGRELKKGGRSQNVDQQDPARLPHLFLLFLPQD